MNKTENLSGPNAENMINDFLNNIEESNSVDFHDIKIEKLNISVRLKHVLLRNGIITFEDLLACPNDTIQNFRNAGKKTLDEVIYLKKHPSKIYDLIKEDEVDEDSTLDKVINLEKNINDIFIENIYNDLSFKDLNMSIRLKNCLHQNKIFTIPLLLKTPVLNIKQFKSLGKKLFEEVLKIKLQLLDVSNTDDTSKLLFLLIKNLANTEPISIIYIKNYLLSNTNYNIELFIDDLNKLKNENKIEISMDGIKIKRISILEYINNLEDNKRKNIMFLRLKGYTLEEIGKQEGITRERIRQISSKMMDNLPEVKETDYKYIFEKYNFNETEFCNLYNEQRETYYFLKLAYTAGNSDIYEGLNTTDFTENQKNIIRKLRNKIMIFGEIIDCNRLEVIKVLAKEYATDGLTFESFTKIYNNFVKMNLEYNLDITDERSIEGILSRQDNILFDFGRKFRYVDYLSVGKNIIDNLHNILKIEDGYYSTLVLFNSNFDLMKEIDIRNEYELHNFFKKNNFEFSEISLDRMPNFSLGNISKNDFTLSKIKELAPISINDFLEIMENSYGHKSNTFLSYLSSEFIKYINGNFIVSDVIEIKEELILELKKIFTAPIYSLNYVKDVLRTRGYQNVDEIITKNNMYKIGYKIRSSYILRKDYESVEDYYVELSRANDFVPNDNIITSSTYSASIKKIEKNYDMILISNKEFITIRKLNKLGISKEMINKFCNDVYIGFKNVNYFTIYNIKKTIDSSWIEENGFDDIFYECLVETIDNIKFLRINNQKIYSFVDDNIDIVDIINEFMIEESISVDELITDIHKKYGIDVSCDKLINNDKYYSKELNKLYLNKECYYKEVYNYE